jgi:hypothetical protein
MLAGLAAVACTELRSSPPDSQLAAYGAISPRGHAAGCFTAGPTRSPAEAAGVCQRHRPEESAIERSGIPGVRPSKSHQSRRQRQRVGCENRRRAGAAVCSISGSHDLAFAGRVGRALRGRGLPGAAMLIASCGKAAHYRSATQARRQSRRAFVGVSLYCGAISPLRRIGTRCAESARVSARLADYSCLQVAAAVV